MAYARDNECERCARPAHRRFCSLDCANESMRSIHGRKRGEVDRRRQLRESAAPGLTQLQMRRLRALWIAQGRTCSYCPALCAQVDHVIPLARGGTNYEGNLAPSCARCNRRKNAMLIVEWRHRGHASWVVIEPPDRKPKIVRAAKPARQSHPCPICSALTLRLHYCSDECLLEMNARKSRERYRARVGLGSTATRPTRPNRIRKAAWAA